MGISEQAQLDEIRALTNELDQNVHVLKRLINDAKEKGDKNTEESPEDLLNQFEGTQIQ